ncbi:cilia- and flagella-associated protein 100 [Aplochiton taeniatus]
MQRQLGLHAHEKMTYSGRVKAKQMDLRRQLREGLDDEGQKLPELVPGSVGEGLRPGSIQAVPSWRVAMIKGERSLDKESINDYITKKRQMFLLEYALAVKRQEIHYLEEMAGSEERKLSRAQKLLEEDSLMFDQFLKENDMNSVQAIKVAEQETKVKLEKMAEIKRLMTKMMKIKSDISKYDDTMREYKLYKDFLFKLSPVEWQEAQLAKMEAANVLAAKKAEELEKEKRKAEKARESKPASKRGIESRASFSGRELPLLRDSRISSRQSAKSPTQTEKASPVPKLDAVDFDYEVEPELYFADPKELLDLLTELEEQNLSLIQNSREAEEALEEFRRIMEHTQRKMEQEKEQLTSQIDMMNHTIGREKERSAELELKARLFNFGKYKSDDQEGMLDNLSRKVEQVYRSCVGDSEASLSTLQMLANIESFLGELVEKVEMIPSDNLMVIERAKDKERRLRQRDEKIRQQKEHQEERMKKALERAQADIKRTTGRKLMSRSQPTTLKAKADKVTDITDKEKEQQLYFFS